MFGIKERETGKVYARHMASVTMKNVIGTIKENVSRDARAIYTDDSNLYGTTAGCIKNHVHEVVIHHDKEWVRGDVSTQGIDSFLGLLKRGIIGSFHQVSIKHLDRYVQEFAYRFNGRESQELFTLTVAALALGIPLPYDKLAGPKETRMVRNRRGVQTPQERKTRSSRKASEPDPEQPF